MQVAEAEVKRGMDWKKLLGSISASVNEELLGKQALTEIATVAKPDTILAWHRTFAGQKVDTSKPHKSVGRPRIDKEIEDLVVRMARGHSFPPGRNAGHGLFHS